MSDDPDRSVVLIEVVSETEAAIISARLDAQGISSQFAGAITAGAWAVAPGKVQVLVCAGDLENARDVLAACDPSATPPDQSRSTDLP